MGWWVVGGGGGEWEVTVRRDFRPWITVCFPATFGVCGASCRWCCSHVCNSGTYTYHSVWGRSVRNNNKMKHWGCGLERQAQCATEYTDTSSAKLCIKPRYIVGHGIRLLLQQASQPVIRPSHHPCSNTQPTW